MKERKKVLCRSQSGLLFLAPNPAMLPGASGIRLFTLETVCAVAQTP